MPTKGPRRSLGDEARAAAALAIEDANAAEEQPRFALRVRAEDGPWGTQARETAALIYEDDCVFLVAGLDGATTHVVEQVATKAQIILVTPWASEDTVTQAGVSWVYRCVPNDRQQLQALLCAASAAGPPAVLVEDSFDGRMARFTLDRLAEKEGHQFAAVAKVPGAAPEQEELARQVRDSHARSVILLGGSQFVADVLPILRREAPDAEIFSLLGACAPQLRAAGGTEDLAVKVAWPVEARGRRLEEFVRHYEEQRRTTPSPLAAFTYDAVSLAVRAISEVGPARADLQEFLSSTDCAGVTGTIAFDETGNRVCKLAVVAAPLMQVSSTSSAK